MRINSLLVPFLFYGCSATDVGDTTDVDDTDDKVIIDTDTEPIVDTDTDTDPTGPTETFDCTTLPPPPTVWRMLNNIPASEDFTIDTDGYLWGVSISTTALVRTLHDGNPEAILPNVSSWGRGTRFLSTGDMVIAEPNSGQLIRVDLAGPSVTPVLGNLQEPNGIAVGDDDMVYLTEMTGKISRVDPYSGDRTVLYDTPISTDGISFAPDYRTLYWNSEQGQVIEAEIDNAGALVGNPAVLANVNTGYFDLLDGMTVDVCGNIYVVRMSGYIVRITPDGQQQELIDFSNFQGGVFISAANFGSGYGGFEKENLYVMNLNGGVFEIEMGIPGKWEPHY